MRKFGLILVLFLFSFSGMFALSNDDIRTLLEKEVATVDDAKLLIISLDESDIESGEMIDNRFERFENLGNDKKLSAGLFAKIVSEEEWMDKGILFSITGLPRYAVHHFIFKGIYPEYFSANRMLSGKELLEFYTAVKEIHDEKKGGQS